MKKLQLILMILLVPLVISGCFGLSKNKPIIEPKYVVYLNQTLGEASYQVRYLEKWEVMEETTGDLGTGKDKVTFEIDKQQQITVLVKQGVTVEVLKEFYNIEIEAQTEVNRLLGTRIIGTVKEDNQPMEAVLIQNGDYVFTLITNLPYSPEFTEFLNNITIFNNLNLEDIPEDEAKVPIYKIYFSRTGTDSVSCQVSYYREVYFNRPADEIELIPKVIQTLLRPEDLRLDELGLETAIPEGTRLLSFGYDNNKAIVNFSAHLNLGGGSCLMSMRRSQIENTLKALSEVSDLQIKEVEIWVDGQADDVLQP